MYSFGFIGCGNMGGALCRAVAKTEKNIAVADAFGETAEKCASDTGAAICDNAGIAGNSEFVVLGVKPQILGSVVSEIAPQILERERAVVISMAAGVSIEKIRAMFKSDVPVIRIMPNTPAAIGEGMIVFASDGVTEKEKEAFLKGFSAAGEIEEIPEKLIDAASAVSGCGPAFVYMFIEALADGGVRCGLPRALAYKLAAKTVGGSAKMPGMTGKHPGELKDAVCSPGGSTIEGVAALEEGAFRGTVSDAVTAAFERTKELG